MADVCRCVFVQSSRVFQLHSDIVWYLQESCTRPEASAAAQACWLSRLQTQVVHTSACCAPLPTAMIAPCPAPLSSSLIALRPGPPLLPTLTPALPLYLLPWSPPALCLSRVQACSAMEIAFFKQGPIRNNNLVNLDANQFDHLRLWVS